MTSYFNMSSEKPLYFIETEDPPEPPKPKLKRQITFLKHLCRPLWQEDNASVNQSFYDTEVDKDKEGIPKVTFTLDALTCGRDGTCSEYQLSREIEKSYQSEKDKCAQQ